MVRLAAPIVLLILASLAAESMANKLNILQVAPNFLTDHFDLNVKLANILVEDGHKVYFLLPLSAPAESEIALAKLNKHSNFHVKVCTLSTDTLHALLNPPEALLDSWQARQYKQESAIAFTEGFLVYKDIHENGPCWQWLREVHANQHFDVGLVDAWDIGALALFHALGIQHTVLTQNFPLMSHFYDFMSNNAHWADAHAQVRDYKQQVLANGVPEVFSALLNDPKVGSAEAFVSQHNESFDIFNSVYNRADEQFKKIFKDDAFPKLRDLFTKAEYLFVNDRRPIDYNLGPLPQRLKFIGGINVPSSKSTSNSIPEHKKLDGQQVVLLDFGSFSPAGMPEHKFNELIKALGKLGNVQVLLKCQKLQTERQQLVQNAAHNVHIVDTVNRQDVLGYADTGLFISLCDVHSALGAIQAGVPLLCVPKLAFNFYTADVLVRKGVALALDHNDTKQFAAEHIRETIAAMLRHKEQYENAIQKLQEELLQEHIEPHKLFLEAFVEIAKKDAKAKL